MQFKTKDLLVNVLPAGIAQENVLCLFRTHICKSPTIIGCYIHGTLCGILGTHCGACSILISRCYCGSWQGTGGGCHFFNSCGPGGSACDFTNICPGGSLDPFVIQNMEDLTTLRTELQATLKSLDAIQKEGLPGSIGSKSEAEALERGLTEALEQVRAAKKKL
jgi:hypothetical protein